MFGSIDWNSLLARKYDILGQQAAADTTRAQAGMIDANANANLSGVKAGLLPGQTAADIEEAKARANLTNVQATTAPGLAKASEAASYGSANANNAQSKLYGAQTVGETQASSILGGGLTSNPIVQALIRRLSGGLTGQSPTGQ